MSIEAKFNAGLFNSEWSFFLLLFSLYVGQGISYGPICLFHLLIPIVLVDQFRKGFNISTFFETGILPVHALIVWVFLSSLYSGFLVNYLYYYGMGYLVFLLLWMKKEFIRTHIHVLVLFFGMLFSLDVLIGALEFATPFRYPISKLSEWNHLFGRPYSIFSEGSECFDLSYVLSSPTGFHWNQNNYALVLLFSLPFTACIRNTIVKNSVRTLLLLLILATGSRLGFSAASVVVLVSVVYEYRSWKSGLLPMVFLMILFTDGFYFFPTGSKKVKEIAFISKSVFSDRFPDHCYEHKGSQDSRKELFKTGLVLLSKHPVSGHGAGGFTRKMQERNRLLALHERTSVNAHNYLLELLVDFGLVILFPVFWMVVLAFRSGRNMQKHFRFMILMCSFTFLIGTVMVSSWVYFITAYLIVFLVYIFLVDSAKNALSIPRSESLENKLNSDICS